MIGMTLMIRGPKKRHGARTSAKKPTGNAGARPSTPNPKSPRKPLVPYFRGDIGGVSAGVSNDGLLSGRTSGFLGDLGFGVEGRAPEFPVGFFAEVRAQWLFLGPRIISVIPVITGATIYF